jgi:uncharacterized protein YdeI (YjbR/CyaY-like superfamily)
MPTPQPSPKVDAVLARADTWREEFERLRVILRGYGLTEALKWGQPCYTHEGRNVVLIHGFKDYCALLFMKGALMKDPNGLLIQQTPNVQSARQIRFTHLGEITQLEPVIRAYVQEAVSLTEAGAKVTRKSTADFPLVDEFREQLEAAPALKAAFQALTPGRQRGYLLHFASAKQAKTRQARVEKCAPLILRGKGLGD